MVIQSLLQTIIAQRLEWLGLVQWKSDMLAAMDEALAAEWSSRRREIGLLSVCNPYHCWSWLCGKSKLTGAMVHNIYDMILIINGTKKVVQRGLDWTSRI
jgi:hypothetical protein